MQALGAYANLLHNQGDEWYGQHIEAATRQLRAAIKGAPQEEALLGVL